MKGLLLIGLIFLTEASFSQSIVLLNIPNTGKAIGSFIPDGYDTLMWAKGDLNKDKQEDFVMVLRHEKEVSADTQNDGIDSIPPRLLVVLFAKGNIFTLAGASEKAILCKDCGGIFGDPLADISVENGILVLYHFGGSNWKWAYTHKFRFQNDGFFLIGKTSSSYWAVSHCEKLDEFAGTNYEDINLITGAYIAKRVSEEGCKLLLNKKGKKPVAPLVKLINFSIENQE